MEKEIYFFSDNTKMSGIVDLPEQKNIDAKCLIMFHGYTSTKDEFGAYRNIAEYFCNQGWYVVRFDFRGCGKSSGKNNRGRMLCYTEWPIDIVNVVNFISHEYSITKNNIVLMGMSMGASSLLHSLHLVGKVRAAILISPVVDGHIWLRKLWTEKHGERAWDKFKGKVEAYNYRLLKDGEEYYDKAENILCFPKEDEVLWKKLISINKDIAQNISYSSVYEIMNFIKLAKYINTQNNIPITFAHGTGDTFVDYTLTEELFNLYSGEKKLFLLERKPHALLLEDDWENSIKIIFNDLLS